MEFTIQLLSKRSLIFCLSILFSLQALSQSTIKGEVVESKDQTKLYNANIMLIQAKDSILIDFARANDNGKFQLKRPSAGDYLLLISYPKYGEYYVELKGGTEDVDLKQIKLSSIEHLLEEVVVTGRIPIVVRGDTTEYDARSFTVEKNAKVEDLLKVLPGISVDASGKITAQGKTVEKVLVDGEEFFGDDPVLVTRNIRSDMVDKVQVYDKKSDQAERTGVDDGVTTKTINLKLKEEAKHGIFGKAEAGVATDKFYIGQGFLNYFKQSLKVSGYLITSNNGKTSLSGNESSMMGDESWGDGNYWGEGIPTTINAGLYYSDKTKDNKHNWRLDYKFNHMNTDINQNNFSQNNLTDTILTTNSTSLADNINKRNRINLKHESKFDSLTTLTIWAGAGNNRSENTSTSNSSTVDQFGSRINDNERSFFGVSKNNSHNISGMLTRKMAKEGRSITFYYGMNGSTDDGNQIVKSKINYYKNDTLQRVEAVDQNKITDNKYFNQSASISYSEPIILKKLIATVEYKFNNEKNSNKIESFNYDSVTANYNQFDAEFSNDFDYNTLKNTYSLSFNYNPLKKLRINMSNFLEQSELKQVDNYSNDKMKRSFLVYAPTMSINFDLQSNKSIYLRYSGKNSLPSLNQIQPLRSNIDPLNEYLGNENLRNAYTHNFGTFFHASNIIQGVFYGAGVDGSITKNALIQDVTTDSVGKNTFIWQNLNEYDNKSISFYGWYNRTLFKKWQIKHGLNPSISFSENYNFINGNLAKALSQSYNFTYGWNKSTTKGLDFEFRFSPGYSIQSNSINSFANSKGFVLSSNGQFKYFLPKKIILETSFNYTYQAPTEIYKESFERLLVNPSISKKFLKNETLVLSFMVNDLLNENIGFSRNIRGTQLEERRYNTIGRYYMLKATWEINKMFIKAN